jgi:hypothetical protein
MECKHGVTEQKAFLNGSFVHAFIDVSVLNAYKEMHPKMRL